MSQFTGKTAFITGGSAGIGRATAQAFAGNGAHVVIADVDSDGAHETERLINSEGGSALAIHCDTTRSTSLQDALVRAVEAFGGIDYAFNNAGVEQPVASLTDIDDEDFDKLMAVDVKGDRKSVV